jgi:cell filamentation protein
MIKDPYVYEGTDILVNKLNIRDSEKLDKAESDFASLAISQLRNEDFKIDSIFDLLEIHRRLFSALYDWAGKPRTINIYKAEPLLGGKSIDYVFASYIDTALKELQKEFATTDWGSLNPSEKIEKVCYFVSEFWHIHPFREGNTRTSAMALYFLIKITGLHVNIGFLSRNGKFFRNALVLSCLYSSSKTGYLLGIVTDSVTLKNEISGKYETIEGTEVKKYSYSHHTTNKLETIKKPADWK